MIRTYGFGKVSVLIENYALGRFFSTQGIIHQESTEQQAPRKMIHASELPGPPRLPIIGNMLHFVLHKEFEKNKLYKLIGAMIKEHGPTFKVFFPGVGPTVVFTKPEDIRQFFEVTLSTPVRVGFLAIKSVRYNAEGNVFNKKAGILTENYDEWRRVRSRVQGPMLKLQSVRSYIPSLDAVSTEFVDSIADMLDGKNETPENFLMELYKWALESIATVSLNTRLGCLARDLSRDSEQMQLIDAVNTLFESMFESEMSPLWNIYPTKAYKQLQKSHDHVHRMTEKYIKLAEESLCQKKSENSQLTMLEAFLKTDSLTRTDVSTIILDMFIGGIDTTSHTVGFALYLLAKNPECQIKLQNEVDSILGDGKSPINEAHLFKFTYLKACLKETLRLYPIVAGVFREFPTDVIINNIRIPKGWKGLTSGIHSARDESLFMKANEFHPERWSKDRPLGKFDFYASVPFSHGTRSCIGRRIAEQEIYILLAKILQRYDVDYKYGEMECHQHLLLVPVKPLKFTFTLRK